ncbi:uncharacterized protein LOC120662811 [Panicum virgatum]|uniref:uncharacterized protein LOC120662811 n=1 Tax=Panicum virgatum TaxID=38727 RepID=UPI0019D6A6A3|nr:uncharacterized protein LOC120662811 [Panicum virgatum]
MSTSSATSASSGAPTMPAATDTSAGALFLHPYATISVKSHVPLELELHSANYGKWSAFFKAMCGKFGLLHHIDGSVPPRRTDPAWEQIDCCIRTWLYGSVSQDVLDFTMAENQTARELWVAISNKFQANKAPRAIFLSEDFHSMTQGDLSVMDFGKKMKLAADALREVGHPVAEPTLVLNLLRGIHPKFSNTKDIVAGTKDITFDEALNQFALKELRMANEAKQQQRRRRKKGGNGSGGALQQQYQQQQPRGPTPTSPWVCFSPWGTPGGQGWSSVGGGGSWRGQGVLGPAPQQAYTAFAPLQFSTPPQQQQYQQPTQTWDQAGLIAALQQMQLQGSSPWVMDSGASTHMHSSDGPQHAARDSSLQ